MNPESLPADLPEYREVEERAKLDTDMSDHLTTLFVKALEAKPRLIVELGVRGGESTFVLERVARLTGATLVSVDLEDCAQASTWDRWHFVKSDDIEFAHQFAGWCREREIEPEIDVLFVDTSHLLEHTREEIRSWLPFLAPRGRIFFHDTNLKSVGRRRDGRKQYGWDNERGVIRALEEVLGRDLDEKRDFGLALRDWLVEHRAHSHGFTILERLPAFEGARPKIAVFCERIDNESFCESVVRELSVDYDVRAYGPGWPKAVLTDLDREDLRFHLELDPASGNFHRPPELELVKAPKVAWLIDTHKKPDFHRGVSREVDLTFYAMRNWGHVLEGKTAWLPLHCDHRIFYPQERERDLDIVFVGSYGWRADAVQRIAKKHGLQVHVECTTGELEKTKTAELYARAKLVFNRHITNDLNFRVFEAMNCGRVLLSDAQDNGQYEIFEDGEHYVLYKNERDLEKQIVELLGDGQRRSRIERMAAQIGRAAHTTRARVRELRQVVERTFFPEVRVDPGEPPAPVESRTPETIEKKRWLVVSGGNYGERLARGLRVRGHEVVLAHEARGDLPPRETPDRVILACSEAVKPKTDVNGALGRAGALHRRLSRVLEREGPFDAVIAEGTWAALVAAPATMRAEVPFFFALERVEVERRGNRLTREQLYEAELEHWAADRARAVIVPNEPTYAAVERFYQTASVLRIAGARETVAPPRGSPDLTQALGLGRFTLVLGSSLSPADKRAILGESREVLVLTSDDLVAGVESRSPRVLSSAPATGAVLSALASAAAAVLTFDPHDERAGEVATVARQLLWVPRERLLAGGDWTQHAKALAPTGPTDTATSYEELEALLEREHVLL